MDLYNQVFCHLHNFLYYIKEKTVNSDFQYMKRLNDDQAQSVQRASSMILKN